MDGVEEPMTSLVKVLGVVGFFLAQPAFTQARPDEEALFGADTGAADAGAAPTNAQSELPPNTPDAGVGALPSDRPTEDALFGNTAPSRPEQPQRPSDQAEKDRESALMDSSEIKDKFSEDETLDDPLRIGGQFYSRFLVNTTDHTSAQDMDISVPTLVDGYFDARPNDRLRGFLLARLRYDPTIDPTALNAFGQSAGSNLSLVLDQLWVRFDIARTIFVTAGKQHVKWGASRFWTPTDFLHDVKRDPLAPFDERTGTSLIKLHLPWEQLGWNFYAIGILDSPTPASVLGKVGGALRAELVFGQTELGLGGVFRKGSKPRFGIDLSSGLGPFDVYGEIAIRDGHGIEQWGVVETPTGPGLDDRFERISLDRETAYAASGGVTYTFAYNDNDTVTLGLEYFHNSTGYSNAALYPWLIFQGEFQPFYQAKHYGAFYALLNSPGDWDKVNFVFSTLGNFSDMTFISRLDVFVRVLTHLTVEMYVAGHYGNRGGEFRFSLDLPPSTLGGGPTPEIRVPAPVVDVGLGFKFSI
jgi:hypothetical protein